jgi:hypothetical protein
MKFDVVGLADVDVPVHARPALDASFFCAVRCRSAPYGAAYDRIRVWSSHALDGSIFAEDRAPFPRGKGSRMVGRCVAM